MSPAPLTDQVLLSRIDRSADCWLLQGHKANRDGYVPLRRQGRGRRAHRVIYELLVGAVPDGLELDHLCRNRACVNPRHLEPVTGRENVLRSPIANAAINSRKTHCPRGHAFSPENTLWQTLPGRHPRRICHTCQKAAYRRYNLKRVRP